MGYETLIKDVGDIRHGFQLFLFLICSFGTANYEYINVVFMTQPIGYQCDWDATLSQQNYSRSLQPFLNGSRNFHNTSQCEMNVASINRTIKCTKWLYDRYDTMFSEYNLVCDRAYIRNLLIGAMWVGFTTSTVTGFLSDTFGRRPIILIYITINILAQYLSLFAYNAWIYYVLQMVKGFTVAYSHVLFNLILELSNVESRRIVGSSFFILLFIGTGVVGWVAYLLPNWRHLQLCYAVFYSISMLLWIVLPESPRWLLAKNRKQEAQEVLDWLCKKNGVAPVDLSDIKLEKKVEVSFWSAFKHKEIMHRVLCVFVLWVAQSSVYYGMTLNLTFVAEDPYVSYCLMSLVELPTIPFNILITKYVKYKTVLNTYTLITTLSIAGVYIVQDYYVPRLIVGLIGKFFSASLFPLASLFTGESFPTSVRTTGYCVMYLARICIVVVPFVIDLKTIYSFLPSCIFVAIGIIQMIIYTPFPETSGKNLPQCINDLEPMQWLKTCNSKQKAKQHRLRCRDIEKEEDKMMCQINENL